MSYGVDDEPIVRIDFYVSSGRKLLCFCEYAAGLTLRALTLSCTSSIKSCFSRSKSSSFDVRSSNREKQTAGGRSQKSKEEWGMRIITPFVVVVVVVVVTEASSFPSARSCV